MFEKICTYTITIGLGLVIVALVADNYNNVIAEVINESFWR